MFSMYKRVLIGLVFFNSYLFALDIYYDPRPPYVQESKNTIEGLVATPLIKSLNNTDIKYVLKNRPSKRHLFEIKANSKEVCALGWFKNKEREEFAKYSKALYQDKPMGIIISKAVKLKEDISLDQLLKKVDLKLLVKDSFSYGKQIDKKIQESKQKIYKVNIDNKSTVFHILRDRADYMFISYEEAIEILKNENLKDKLVFKKIKHVPAGNKRYLMCSKKVSDEMINSINKYIK